MDRRHLPLLLASPALAAADESEPLDRLRIQKGVFLLEQRGPEAWRGLYSYRPYDWGPYSDQLSSDVASMAAGRLLERDTWPNRRYQGYKTSVEGQQVIEGLIGDLPPEHLHFARQVRHFVTTRSFNKLLRDVYAEYPEYAVNSRFRTS